MMVANKTDVVPYESLPAHTRAAIEEVQMIIISPVETQRTNHENSIQNA